MKKFEFNKEAKSYLAKLLAKRALWNKKHIPVPLINWVAPAAVGVK